ncbi:MAG: flagellar basal body protein, partial [Anaerotruncus colihominis]
MNIAFYNGVSGLVAYQQEMDLVSNNVANVNTVGYKPSRASFSDLLYTQMWTNTDALVNAGGDAGAQDTA